MQKICKTEKQKHKKYNTFWDLLKTEFKNSNRKNIDFASSKITKKWRLDNLQIIELQKALENIVTSELLEFQNMKFEKSAFSDKWFQVSIFFSFVKSEDAQRL